MAMKTKEELAEISRLGKETYFRLVRPQLRKEDEFKHVIFDIDTGEYEIDKDSLAASRRMKARRPDGRLFGILAGYTVGGWIGGGEANRDPM